MNCEAAAETRQGRLPSSVPLRRKRSTSRSFRLAPATQAAILPLRRAATQTAQSRREAIRISIEGLQLQRQCAPPPVNVNLPGADSAYTGPARAVRTGKRCKPFEPIGTNPPVPGRDPVCLLLPRAFQRLAILSSSISTRDSQFSVYSTRQHSETSSRRRPRHLREFRQPLPPGLSRIRTYFLHW